jgi:hypothetical protein
MGSLEMLLRSGVQWSRAYNSDSGAVRCPSMLQTDLSYENVGWLDRPDDLSEKSVGWTDRTTSLTLPLIHRMKLY